MSIFDEKIAAARAIIDEFNSAADSDADKINQEVFFKKLKAAGGTTDAALVECMWEDIQGFGATVLSPEGVASANGLKTIPILTAKRIATVFRKRADKPKVLTEKRVLHMNARELFESYDAKDPDSAVGKRLLSLTSGRPVLVFNEDNTINIDATLICWQDLQNGLEPRDVFVGPDGVPQPLYAIGAKPDSVVTENPLLPGHALRGSDEMCDRTHRSWAKIPHKIRVLIRLALSLGELKIDHFGKIHDTLDLFVGKTTELMQTTANQRFPQAVLKYKELEKAGSLPTLKIVKTNAGPAGKKQDPFFGGHRTY